jgi:hypothetical protein
MATVRRLNLGCGNNIIGDAVNVDLRRHRPEIDEVWDLSVLPWPWDDESFDHIIAKAVFEHLKPTLLECIDECWRILTVGGLLELKLPYWAHEVSYNDPTHRYAVGLGIFDVLDPETKKGAYYEWYTPRKWKILRCELNPGGTCVIGLLEKRDVDWQENLKT